MIPTGQNVFDLVRSIVGDTEVAGGQWMKNQFIQGANNTGPAQSAYNWLFERMRTYNDRRSRRTSFALVNPNINYISPKTIGISNMGNPIDIWERGTVLSYAITGAVITPPSTGVDPFIRLAVAHAGALKSGQTVEVYLVQGISDDINDYWTISVPDNNHIDILGSTAQGVYTGATGLVLSSTEAWPNLPMHRSYDLFQEGTANQLSIPGISFANWQWQTSVIRVPPCSAAREIKLNYNLSGTIPADPNASLGIDDSLNVLAYKMAAIAGGSKTTQARRVEWDGLAERLLKEFLQPVTKDLQRERLVAPRYRPRRNTGYSNPY